MPQSLTLVFVHFVWATWDRWPIIRPEWKSPIYGCITEKCTELRCELIAIGGIEDHVHVLTRLHANVFCAELVQKMKGASSHLITQEVAPGEMFKWQGGYGALSVSHTHVRRVANYIDNQQKHHYHGKIWAQLESFDIE